MSEAIAVDVKEKNEEKKQKQSQPGKSNMAEIRKNITNRNLELAMRPDSIAIAPRTPEGNILTQILMNFDKALNIAHVNAGVMLPMETVIDIQQDVDEVISKVSMINGSNPLYSSNSGYTYDPDSSMEAKKRLIEANMSSRVLIPRTIEGNKLARAIKNLDSQLVLIKTTCTDFAAIVPLINATIEFTKDFYALTKRISTAVKMKPTYSSYIADKINIADMLGEDVEQEIKQNIKDRTAELKNRRTRERQ